MDLKFHPWRPCLFVIEDLHQPTNTRWSHHAGTIQRFQEKGETHWITVLFGTHGTMTSPWPRRHTLKEAKEAIPPVYREFWNLNGDGFPIPGDEKWQHPSS